MKPGSGAVLVLEDLLERALRTGDVSSAFFVTPHDSARTTLARIQESHWRDKVTYSGLVYCTQGLNHQILIPEFSALDLGTCS